MTDVIVPTLQQLYGQLAPWLCDITGLDQSVVLQGLPNRAAMPPADPGFIAMTILRRERLNYSIIGQSDDVTDDTQTNETHYKVTVQLDFYGAAAYDWCGIVESLWKSAEGCAALGGLDSDGNPLANPICQPLYTDPSILAALDDGEEEYENRWLLGAVMQYNPVVMSVQDYATAATVQLINVDEAYK